MDIRKGKPERIPPGPYNAIVMDVETGTKDFGGNKIVPFLKFTFKILDNVPERLRKFTAKNYYQTDAVGTFLDPDKPLYKWLSGLYNGDTARMAAENPVALIGTRCIMTVIKDGDNAWLDTVQVVSAAPVAAPVPPVTTPIPPVTPPPVAPVTPVTPAPAKAPAASNAKLSDMLKNETADDDLISLLGGQNIDMSEFK